MQIYLSVAFSNLVEVSKSRPEVFATLLRFSAPRLTFLRQFLNRKYEAMPSIFNVLIFSFRNLIWVPTDHQLLTPSAPFLI